jgi:hypothetical protein
MNILRTNRATNQTSIVSLETAVAAIEKEYDSNAKRTTEQLAQGHQFFTAEGSGIAGITPLPHRPIVYRKEELL